MLFQTSPMIFHLGEEGVQKHATFFQMQRMGYRFHAPRYQSGDGQIHHDQYHTRLLFLEHLPELSLF